MENTMQDTIHILQFSCGNKRLINTTAPFIGKEIILWLSGIKQREGFVETKKHLNEAGENIYFKDIMPVSAWQWDMYMYSIKHGIAPDARFIAQLNQFNEMIGGDERVDDAIKKSNHLKPYNPLCPGEDSLNLYTWRVSGLIGMSYYRQKDEWSISGIIPETGFSGSYWLRKRKKDIELMKKWVEDDSDEDSDADNGVAQYLDGTGYPDELDDADEDDGFDD